MKKTTVSLGGINRNDYDGSAHIVNLRLKDKAFRPVPEPTKVDKEIDGKVEYIHASSDYRNLIDYKHYASVTEVYYRGNLNNNEKEQSILIGSFQAKVLDVSHIGNTLIFLTDNGQYYFIFKNGEYKSLGNKIPEVKVKFKAGNITDTDYADSNAAIKPYVANSVYFHKADTKQLNGINYGHAAYMDTGIENAKTIITQDFESQYNEAINKIYQSGVLPTYHTQVRVGMRLYDGSYVYHTAPISVIAGNGKKSLLYNLRSFEHALNYVFRLNDDDNKVIFTQNGLDFPCPPKYYYQRQVEIDGNRYEFGVPSKNSVFRKRVFDETVSSNASIVVDYPFVDGHVFIQLNKEFNNIRYPGEEKIFAENDIQNLCVDSSWRVYHDPMGDALAEMLGVDRYDVRDNKQYYSKTNSCRLALKVSTFKAMFDFPEDLEDWKDIISSIDIAVSKPITPYKIGELCNYPVDNKTELYYNTSDWSSSYDDLILKKHARYNEVAPHRNLAQYSDDVIYDDVKQNGNFYTLKTISIASDEHKQAKYRGWVSFAEDIKEHMSMIEQCKPLEDDYMSRNRVTAKAVYTYNQSLHLAGISSILFKGFSPYDFCVNDGKNNFSNKGYCKVLIDGGVEKCVSINLNETEAKCSISPMLYYPDTKAKSIEIGVYDNFGKLRKATFPLAPHPSLNGAYYLNPSLEPIVVNIDTSMPAVEVSATIVEPNKMIATSISNPFVFTAERTNYVGTGSILAMHAATTALSQGQSAQLPLYVFCTDGVYALTTNTQGEYMTSQNVTFDILADKKKLCATENAIVFGTQQGLKVIQGGTSALLSAPLNGSAHRYGKGEHYENPYLESFIPGMDMRDFNDFLCDADTSVHYDYPNNEVWVFNPRSRYAYILSLYNNVWSMRSKDEADSIISAYPSLYLRNGNSLADVTPDNDSKLPFAIITNPIGGQEFTRIADITIDTRFITDNIRCTLLAGNNPFRLAKVRTLRAEKPHGGNPVPTPSLHLGRIPASVRYVQFAMDGHVTEANLTGFTMLTDTESYNPVR